MVDDPDKRVNLYEKYPDKTSEMDRLIQEYRSVKRTNQIKK